MKLHEYQAKECLARFGVAVPANGGAAVTPAEASDACARLGGRCVLKAQVHTGGRGKGGGIRMARTPQEAEELAGEMLGMLLRTVQAPAGITVRKLLVEEPLAVASELYAGIVPDRARQRNVLIVSAMGGVDIEAVAEEHPEAVARVPVDPALGLRDFHLREACYQAGLPKDVSTAAQPLLRALYEAFESLDASLLEVNPLAVTADGRLLAADAKVTIDDNALFRHPELEAWQEESEEDPIEAQAHRRGIQYVKLDGHIGVIGNGAGLVMTTLDEVARAGGKAANFLDIGGGARADLVRSSLELVMMNPNVRGVLVNIFGGITRGDEVARGIINAIGSLDVGVPIVVRLAGTRAEEGRALLAGTPLVPAATMAEAAQTVVELAG